MLYSKHLPLFTVPIIRLLIKHFDMCVVILTIHWGCLQYKHIPRNGLSKGIKLIRLITKPVSKERLLFPFGLFRYKKNLMVIIWCSNMKYAVFTC